MNISVRRAFGLFQGRVVRAAPSPSTWASCPPPSSWVASVWAMRPFDGDARGDVEHEVEVLLHYDHRQPGVRAQVSEDLPDLLHDRGLDALRSARPAACSRGPPAQRSAPAPAAAARRRTARRRDWSSSCHEPREQPQGTWLEGLLLGARRRPASTAVAMRRFSSTDSVGRMLAALRARSAMGRGCAAPHARASGRDVPALAPTPARRRPRSSAHQRLQQRGLAHAVVADDAQRLAGLERGERHPVQHRHGAIAGTQIAHLEDHARRRTILRRAKAEQTQGCLQQMQGCSEWKQAVRRSLRAVPDIDLAHARVGQHLLGRLSVSTAPGRRR